MDTPSWTVVVFQQRRRKTWRAIRIWLLVLLIGVIGFEVPFWLNHEHVETSAGGVQTLRAADESIAQFTLGLVSLVVILVASGAILFGVRRHYRCPKCEEIPMSSWGTTGLDSFGFDRGIALRPTGCPNCGAPLS